MHYAPFYCSFWRLDEDQRQEGLCVVFGDKTFEVKVSEGKNGLELKFGDLSWIGGGNYISGMDNPTTLTLTSQWILGHPIMTADINGKEVTVQVQCSEKSTS